MREFKNGDIVELLADTDAFDYEKFKGTTWKVIDDNRQDCLLLSNDYWYDPAQIRLCGPALTPYYGDKDDPYEAIKVIQKWGLNFALGNVAKYIKRCGLKEHADEIEDLKKAVDYLNIEIEERESRCGN